MAALEVIIILLIAFLLLLGVDIIFFIISKRLERDINNIEFKKEEPKESELDPLEENKE